MFTPALQPALDNAAATLGIPSLWLKAAIEIRSGWTHTAVDTHAKRGGVAYGAVGLIQFLPHILNRMGLLSSSVKVQIPPKGMLSPSVRVAVVSDFLSHYATAQAQLMGPVIQYLNLWKPFTTSVEVLTAISFPAPRGI